MGQASSGWYTAPLVLADTSPDMPLPQEDIMAPVLSLMSVRDDEQSLAAARRCPYALGATIFGAEQEARALAPRLRAGVVVINDVIVPTADPRLPLGGRDRSGYGLTRGAEGLLALTAVKAVALRHSRWCPHFDVADARDANLFQAYIAAAHGATWRQRAAACWALLQGIAVRAWRQGQQGEPS